MKKQLKLNLINGLFDASDMTDVILSMIDKKIEFNELTSFRNFVKFNKKDLNLQQRIEDLKQTRTKFLEFAKNNQDAKFKIQSEININTV